MSVKIRFLTAIAVIASTGFCVSTVGGDRTVAMPSHGDAGGHSAGHPHGTVEVPTGQPMPSVKLIVTPDAMRGWNIQAQVNNFTFAPERVNQSSQVSEGHAHLFVDGKKVARLYSPWYYLETLPPGQHTISVVLNTNTHQDLSHNGKLIQDSVVITVPQK